MDIRQLEAFVYTVKYQSFSLAAQKLYISQPTVSAHIRSLEEEFHTQLLKRTTKSLSLTPAGTKLYSYATEILTLQQKAIVELANETKPQLRIGASSVPSLYFLGNEGFPALCRNYLPGAETVLLRGHPAVMA